MLGGFLTELANAEMSDNVRMKIFSTTFHHFMHSPPLEVDFYLLDDICGRYISDYMFQLGSKQLVCTVEDFGWILGLPYQGTMVDIHEFSKHHNSFYDSRLHGYELSRGSIGLRFRKLSQEKGMTPKQEDDISRATIGLKEYRH